MFISILPGKDFAENDELFHTKSYGPIVIGTRWYVRIDPSIVCLGVAELIFTLYT